MKRTHLPLNGLRVLDAAARHLSFTRAADELAVTPAAVGQQIRALEDLLGVILFRRTSKGLELTDEAAAGLDAIREGFLRFEEGVQAMRAGQSSHVYTIACPRDFFAAWLSSRLAAFRETSPQLRFSLIGGNGDVTATFDNGTSRVIAQVALATFDNYNGLTATSGDAFVQSAASGAVTLQTPQSGQAGAIEGSALESSTVDLSAEFTSLISTQNAYNAASKIITTADNMETVLEQIIPG